ncbi:MAG: ABC transporter ATP-binding protein [Lachnospiraceae bacterium]|nr:ABC transporter ATP-binding protein [Lachnospiraceae bacterium]
MMCKQRKHGIISNIIFAIGWQFRVAPWYTLLYFLQMIVGDIITLFEHTFLVAYIIGCVERGGTLTEVLYFLVPVAVAVTIKVCVNPLIDSYITPKSSAKIKEAIHMKLYEKAASMEISRYDDSQFYNDFVWAMQKAPEHVTAATNTFRTLLSKLIVVAIAGSYIISTDALAVLVVAVIMVSTLLSQHIINQWKMKREEDILPVSRKRDYVNRVFYLADYVKDIKSSQISKKLEKDFGETSEQMRKLVKKHGPKISALTVLRDSVDYILYDGAYLTYLFYQALVQNKFGLGSLLALYKAANQLSGNLRRVIMMLPEFQNHSLYLAKLRTFLETENKMPDEGTLHTPETGDILLQDVHFTYPGNDRPTIKGVSMEIKKGEKIALVGFNGAGKSTLIKLLLRLYDPDSGSVHFAQQSIKEYPITDYRKRFGVLFQDFEMIATDIGHNLNMSNQVLDEQRADEVLKKVAFWERFQTMPQKYGTQLTKEFDEEGINLSGGEAQKIALARVLYADSGVIILDEPSSALDPIAEYQLNKTVTELAEDKTVIIISHRLSTTRFVDKIYMLENGRIIEQGNHESLLALKGKYAEMFTLQAEKYR